MLKTFTSLNPKKTFFLPLGKKYFSVSSQNQNASQTQIPTFQNILCDIRGKKSSVGFIQLNRPKVNALCNALMADVSQALSWFEKNKSISCVVLTGNEKFFAAGADIKEMENLNFIDCVQGNFLSDWTKVAHFSKPIIAAVSGFALGGGCELAMMCDIIYASKTAQFGQPEIKLGTIPGAGGTQRLTRIVGKSKAMELCLTGETFSAQEAFDWGLVSKIHPAESVVSEAIHLADKISEFSKPIVQLCKASVNQAYETSLAEGLHFERRLFHSTFATNDRKEGMTAFASRKAPQFKDE